MARDLVLTIDAGTGSVRALVYATSEHEILAVASQPLEVSHPSPDRAEFNPERCWSQIQNVMGSAVQQAGRAQDDYLGITATTLRQGFVLLDENGSPLTPGVLNYDRRGAHAMQRLKDAATIEELYQRTGHWFAPELTLPKLLWFQEQEPELWAKAASFHFIHDWLLYRLTAQRGTNATLICAGQMADVSQRTWAFDLLDTLEIPEHLLPPVYEAGHPLGGLLQDVAQAIGLMAGTPVHIGGGDTQFGCLGAGGMEAGRLVVVGGSTTPLMLATRQPFFDPLRYPWVSTNLDPGLWAVETNAGHTGMLYKWLRDTFRVGEIAEVEAQTRSPYALLDNLAAASPIGANGLKVIASSPRWAQDTWERKAPYAFHGFSVSHTLGDFARAILESVCYAVRGNLEQMERATGVTIEDILYTGGTASPPIWAQMMCDVLERPIQVPQVVEPAAVAGAQVVLWAQTGEPDLPAPDQLEYQPDPERSRAYASQYSQYVEIFERMQAHFSA